MKHHRRRHLPQAPASFHTPPRRQHVTALSPLCYLLGEQPTTQVCPGAWRCHRGGRIGGDCSKGPGLPRDRAPRPPRSSTRPGAQPRAPAQRRSITALPAAGTAHPTHSQALLQAGVRARALQVPGKPPRRNPSAASKVAGVEMMGEHRTCTERLVGDAGVRGPQGGHGPGNQHSPCRGLQQTQHTDAKAHAPAAAPSGGLGASSGRTTDWEKVHRASSWQEKQGLATALPHGQVQGCRTGTNQVSARESPADRRACESRRRFLGCTGPRPQGPSTSLGSRAEKARTRRGAPRPRPGVGIPERTAPGAGPQWGSRGGRSQAGTPGWTVPVHGPERGGGGAGGQVPGGRAGVQAREGARARGPRGPVPGAGRCAREQSGGRAAYLGTQLGLEPSTSQVANRFMGTGVLSAAGAPARPKRPRSAMAPAPAAPSAAWAAAGPRTRGGRAGGPGARRAAARSHGCRAAGPAGRATDRPAGGDQAAAAPPRPARARARRARPPPAAPPSPIGWVGARSPTRAQSCRAEGSPEVRFARPLPPATHEAPPPAAFGSAPPRLRTGPAQSAAPRPPRSRREGPERPQGPPATLSPAATAPASASPRPPVLRIPESARSHAIPASPDAPIPLPCPMSSAPTAWTTRQAPAALESSGGSPNPRTRLAPPASPCSLPPPPPRLPRQKIAWAGRGAGGPGLRGQPHRPPPPRAPARGRTGALRGLVCSSTDPFWSVLFLPQPPYYPAVPSLRFLG
ncbi:collagen alpha-1(I) chain-like [Cervus canadensis]|uniref:collagen alpha-1(I) chain-like n=1 Tax=Cervus canadensis TaxID=1574408 RepID=UPI001C9E49B3|nr:collagen alpha-1(I) chain-like [Cervus canadensis]